ncbi:glycoside hydrolase family 31 protein [Butyrivibrio sp. TB]|uniref:glycoside hydrolase family 31 protein n=1 Tax=Butyrivibrio sp. TB TaxID=1520809 RepID=UPI0008ACD57D|nr:TIM-barrel domain-containing protein [Butyrivibrio sp. TB]SEP59472.1 alpha-D-xyloside xylohydrolase [Butyrivibrio sp. TB]
MIRLETDKTGEIIKIDRGDISITYTKEGEMCQAVIQNNYKHIYGMGEKFDYIDQKGHTCINRVEEKFCNQGDKTYCSIPFFFTDSGWGLFVETDCVTSFEFEKEIRVNFPVNASLFLFQGKPLDIIKEFNNYLGIINSPPRYAFGPWISANRWNSQKDVEEVVANLENYDFPATVLVLEAWSDEATFYIWNGAKYKEKIGKEAFKYEDFDFSASEQWDDPKQMVKDLTQKGIHTVLWQIPVYKKMEEGIHNLQNEIDEKYAIDNKLCLYKKDGSPYRIPEGNWFAGSLVPDFSNPETKEAWFSKRQYLLDMGISGFKTDGGEFIYDDSVVSSNNKTGKELKNAYCQEYTRTYYDYLGKENVLFSRAGYTGAQRTPILWAGDHQSTYKELKNVYRAAISAACSGIIFWGFDIGGFAGPLPSADLYLKSTQFACFCPVMQWHSEPDGGQFKEILKGAEGNNERSPWNIARFYGKPELLDEIRKWHKLRMKLIPYIYGEAQKAADKGIPMMRMLFMENPTDEKAYDYEDEYYFGDDLLVAPLFEENIKSRTLYLPKGKWIGMFSKNLYEGGGIVSSDNEEYPVFIRQGADFDIDRE